MPHQSHPQARRTAGNTVPIVVGLSVMVVGAFGMFTGVMSLLSQDTDKGQTISTMSLIGGLFLLLTGLWFMTRSRPTPARVIGLIIMVCAVVGGTYVGRHVADMPGEGHTEVANVAFMCGLLLHLSGVIYVVKAKE